jgi:hypothetical protein
VRDQGRKVSRKPFKRQDRSRWLLEDRVWGALETKLAFGLPEWSKFGRLPLERIPCPARLRGGPVSQWIEPAAHNGLVAGSSSSAGRSTPTIVRTL